VCFDDRAERDRFAATRAPACAGVAGFAPRGEGHPPSGREGGCRPVDERVTDELTLTADPRSIRVARGFLTSIARDLDVPSDTVSVAELALSEIITNAVVHGLPPIVLHIDATASRLEVSVSDGSPAQPRAEETRLDATGGRGLAIVAAVAGAWGCEPDPAGPGKRIWFSVSG
jgi:anti-sigma regulatory factor (Ser/Thr protein kinase)